MGADRRHQTTHLERDREPHGRAHRGTDPAARFRAHLDAGEVAGRRFPQGARSRLAARLRHGRLRRDGPDGLDRGDHPRGIRRLGLRLCRHGPHPRGDRPHPHRLAAAGQRPGRRQRPDPRRDGGAEAGVAAEDRLRRGGRHPRGGRGAAPRARQGRARGQGRRRRLQPLRDPRPSCPRAWRRTSSSSRRAPAARPARRTGSPSSSFPPTRPASRARR